MFKKRICIISIVFFVIVSLSGNYKCFHWEEF